MDAFSLLSDAGVFGLLGLLVYSILRAAVGNGKRNYAEPMLASFTIPVKRPQFEKPPEKRVRPTMRRKPTGWLGKIVRWTTEPWIVICTFLWLACLPLAASGYAESIQGSALMVGPNALMAWTLTGLMTLILVVSLLGSSVSEEYETLQPETESTWRPLVSSGWEEFEP
jgi:hypothetical protein